MKIANAGVEISSMIVAKHEAAGMKNNFHSSRYSVTIIFLALKSLVFFCMSGRYLLCFIQSFPPIHQYHSDQSIAEIMKMSHVLDVGEVGRNQRCRYYCDEDMMMVEFRDLYFVGSGTRNDKIG